MIRRALLPVIMFAAAILSAAAGQRVLFGRVADADSASVAGAMVRAYNGSRIAAYGATDAAGRFRLPLHRATTVDTLRLTVTCLGYEPSERTVVLGRRDSVALAPFILTVSSKKLREVVVTAPDIRERGDTMAFRLGAYAGKSDVTLEDGLKKIPGVEVDPGGAIRYLGRNISNFYVEGLQLAGKRYTQITRNLPAQYVTDVELIENHQEARIDSGRKSDNVAMNVRLSPRVRFRPVGTASGALGIRGNDPLYSASATGMLFSHAFQTIVTLKADNIRRVAMAEAGQSISSAASSAEGGLYADHPPLDADRYVGATDRLATANAIKSLGRENTMRANAFYAFSQTGWGYTMKSHLFDGSEHGADYEERYDPLSSIHRAGLDLNFRHDALSMLVGNNLSGQFEFERSAMPVGFVDAIAVGQQSRVRNWRIADYLSLAVRNCSRLFRFAASGAYTITPVALLTVGNGGETGIYGTQAARSRQADAAVTTGFSWDPSRCSRFMLPLSVRWAFTSVTTDWSERRAINDMDGHRATLNLAPGYEYTSRRGGFNLFASLGVSAILLHADNNPPAVSGAERAESRIARLFLNPSVRVKLECNRYFTLKFSASHDRAVGDMLELLTEPVMQSFRNVAMRSGNIGFTRTTSATVSGKFVNTISLWFADFQANASRQTRSLLSSREIGSGGATQIGALSRDNHGNSVGLNGSVTKQLRRIGLKFTLRCSYTLSSTELMQQGELLTSYHRMLRIQPQIVANPWPWIELRLNSSWQKNFSRYLSSRTDNRSWITNGRLILYPFAGWELSGTVDYIRKADATVSYPSVALFDLGVTWRVGKFRLTFRADNLLDRRSYHYTTYVGPDTYNYTFRLLGRSLTAGLTLTL